MSELLSCCFLFFLTVQTEQSRILCHFWLPLAEWRDSGRGHGLQVSDTRESNSTTLPCAGHQRALDLARCSPYLLLCAIYKTHNQTAYCYKHRKPEVTLAKEAMLETTLQRKRHGSLPPWETHHKIPPTPKVGPANHIKSLGPHVLCVVT